jgi:hypothetical protein
MKGDQAMQDLHLVADTCFQRLIFLARLIKSTFSSPAPLTCFGIILEYLARRRQDL